MSESDVAAQSRKFYERYHFPGTRPLDRDGLILLRHFASMVEQMKDRDGRAPIRVLDAGCGTGNTSVALARRFTRVQFFGLDQSKRSLAEARRMANREGLQNLRFRRWDLMAPLPKMKPFDIVLCLGVLHHTANMKRAIINLRRAMKPSGVLFLWIYGKHGRYRHTLNTRALQYLIQAGPKKEALDVAREFVRSAGKRAPISDLLGGTPTSETQRDAFESPTWIADQFLNPHEELLDMEELMNLVDQTGFEIERDLGQHRGIAEWLDSPSLLHRYQKLRPREQQTVLDLLAKPDRYFVMLRVAS